MSWKAELTKEEHEVLANEASRDFARVVRKGMTLGLFRIAKSQMTKEEAARFDAYRLRQAVHASLHPNERSWFDQIQDKIAELVDGSIIQLDDYAGGHGRRGTAWVEQQFANMSVSLRRWWQS